MSVAFRRDSDEEHLEPKFELPIPAGPNLVTARGLRMIGDRIAELEARLHVATNEAAIAALKRDLRYYHTRQISAQVAPTSSADAVEFGVQVSILLNGTPKTFQIVGDDEADPEGGLISFNAPLSRAMLGAEAGEVLPFGNAADAIEILEINEAPKCKVPSK
jgi:transcription elongation GreA/GreB family factor